MAGQNTPGRFSQYPCPGSPTRRGAAHVSIFAQTPQASLIYPYREILSLY